MVYYMYLDFGNNNLEGKACSRFYYDGLYKMALEAGEQSRSACFWLGEEGEKYQPIREGQG